MTLKTETLDWHHAGEPPDADLTVMIEVDPDSEYSEPVFMGYTIDGCWYDIHNMPVDVIAWAEVPKGTRG